MVREITEATRKHDRERMRRKMDHVRAYKAARGCQRCPEQDPDCLELHHLDPSSKNPKLTIANGRRKQRLQSIYNLGWSAIDEELEKCEVLCANCHAREEAARRREKYPDRWAA